MPKQLHEVIVEMFRSQPKLAVGLLADAFDFPLPDYEQIRAASTDFTDIGPHEFRGDTAFVLSDHHGTEVLGIVVEIQLGRDPTRQWSWPVYVATLRSRLHCPVILLVVCPSARIAAWSRRPIALGHPGLVLRPLVLSPDLVPPVTDLDVARSAPERAALSALAHINGPAAEQVYPALLAALDQTEREHALLYYGAVLALMSKTTRHRLEKTMQALAFKYEFQSDFTRKYVAEGKAEGLAEGRTTEAAVAVLSVLDARRLEITDEIRERITQCADIDQLHAWLRRAILVESASDLFD